MEREYNTIGSDESEVVPTGGEGGKNYKPFSAGVTTPRRAERLICDERF